MFSCGNICPVHILQNSWAYEKNRQAYIMADITSKIMSHYYIIFVFQKKRQNKIRYRTLDA